MASKIQCASHSDCDEKSLCEIIGNLTGYRGNIHLQSRCIDPENVPNIDRKERVKATESALPEMHPPTHELPAWHPRRLAEDFLHQGEL